MLKSRSITLLISIVLLIALICASVVSLAYFNIADKVASKDTIATSPDNKNDDTNVIKVANYKELIYAAADSSHNSDSTISTIRRTVMLTGDIRLSNHLYVTADVNLDLNNYQIDTRGYNIYIEHYYIGVIAIYGGNILSTRAAASLYIQTPRASVRVDNVNYDNISERVISYDTAILLQDCYELIARSLEGNMSSRAFYNANGNRYAPRSRGCTNHSVASNDNNCNNIYDDIDLPIDFYAYGVTINYISSDSNALAPNGRINVSGGRADVTLTAVITHAGESISRDFNLHIVDINNMSIARDIAAIELIEYMERHYYEGVLEGGTDSVQLYNIPDSIMIPRYNSNSNIEYSYITVASDGSVIDSTDNIAHISFELDKNNANANYILTVGKEVDRLIVNIDGRADTISLKVNGSHVSTVQDNYTRALAITRALYGEEIVVINDKSGYNGYSTQALSSDMSEYERGDRVSVAYSLSYDIDKTYSIGAIGGIDSIYVVNVSNPPTEIQRLSLKAKFTFDSGGGSSEDVTITIPIRYDSLIAGDGNTVPRFWAYYRYFDRLLLLETGGYTYKSFTMPFGYEYGEPIFYFDVIGTNGQVNNDIITQSLVYTLSGTKYTRTLAEVLAMNQATIESIHDTATAKWHYSINIDKVPLNDSHLKLRYRYKFLDYSGAWQGDGAGGSAVFESALTVPGLIKPSNMNTGVEDYILDTNLYAYIYNNSNPQALAAPYVVNSNMYIIYSWLDKEFVNEVGKSEIDNSSRRLKINSYEGLQLLKNVRSLNLSAAVTNIATEVRFIAGMTGLVELNLSNNAHNVYDRKSSSYGFPTGTNSNFLSTLKVLVELEVLHLEKNTIYYFKDLLNFPNLKSVYIYGSTFTEGSWLSGIASGLYGAKGLVNLNVFNRLTGQGVLVYNIDEATPYKISAETNVIINALNNILYQERLPYGVPITDIYNNLSWAAGDYVSKQSTALNKSDTLKFSHVGDAATATEFYATFTYYASVFFFGSTEIEIEVYYPVSRY